MKFDLFNPPNGMPPEEIYKAFQEQGVHYVESTELTKPKLYIGLDPGKHGGIVGITSDRVVFKEEMPLLGDDVDSKALHKLITGFNEDYNIVLVVEDVHSIYGTSSGSNFTFGYVCGQIDAVIKLSGVKHLSVQPKTWQKSIWSNSDMMYKPKKPDQKKASVDTKATSMLSAKRLFPNEDLRGNLIVKYYADSAQNRKLKRVGALVPSAKNNDHDGIVDAVLIAEYARRMNF